MTRADDLRAELELAELEDELATAKRGKTRDAKTYRALKDKVRAARQTYREQREG